ncbi:MAG: histidine phosphatase family protein [Anaerosacchariphilus sp.]
MKELYLIRHGKTYGNTLGRYIGTTDEPLCEEGREACRLFSKRGSTPCRTSCTEVP